MSIPKDKMRIMVCIPKNIKDTLKNKAKSENKSVSNYVYTLIMKDLNIK